MWWYFAQRSSLCIAAPRSSATGSSASQSHMHKIRFTARLPTIIQSTSRTVDTDVKQGCETLAAEKVDSAQVEDHLLRSAGVPCDEASEGLAIGGVYVARDGDTYALGCQVVNFEDGAATSLCFVDGRQLRLIEPDSVSRGHEVNSFSWSPRQWRKSNGPAV